MADKEVWKPYPEYPFIEVSSLGRVRTKERVVICKNGSKRLYKSRILKQHLLPNGYLFVHSYANDKQFNIHIHRAVAICFIPNPDNLPEVNHIDNDKTNNSVSNLEWCTHEYNMAYKEKYGKSAAELFGHPVIAINLKTSDTFWFKSQMEAERQLGVKSTSIVRVVNGKQNKTGDYWFCNADLIAIEKTRKKFGDEVANKVKELMREHL